MSSSYGAIPKDSTDSGSTAPSDSGGFSTKTKIIGAIVAILIVVGLSSGGGSDSGSVATTAPTLAVVSEEGTVEAEPEEPEDVAWPPMMITGPGFQTNPTNTDDAPAGDWVKTGEPCDPKLGESYRRNGGSRTEMDPQTLYFTPALDGTPGIFSGIAVDFYGYVEENLIEGYFGDEKVEPDSGKTYHTLSVAFRDYDEHDLCDTSEPITHTDLERITIAPHLAAENLPLKETDSELVSDWTEGSCIIGMGFHWAKDVTGNEITWLAENLVPIVPMYNSHTGDFQALFFLSTIKRQIWREGCALDFGDLTQPCTADINNSWDRTPGLFEENDPLKGTFMCSNFCGDCQFSGSPDGMYATIHYMFASPAEEDCQGKINKFGLYCRNGEYPGGTDIL
jgi:hypothetical protein